MDFFHWNCIWNSLLQNQKSNIEILSICLNQFDCLFNFIPLLVQKRFKMLRQSNMHKKLNQELNTLSCKLREGRFGVEMVTIYFTLVVRNAKKWFLSKRILITFLGMTLILITITQKRNHEKSVNKCQKKILLLEENNWKLKLKFIS